MKHPSVQIKQEKRAIVGTHPVRVAKFTAEGKLACSIEAMLNGGECEACL